MASPLLLCIVLCSYYSIAHGRGNDSFVTVPTSAFEPEQVCSGERVTPEQKHCTVSLPLVHRHGPCAPSPSTDKPSFSDTLRRSRARVNHIAARVARSVGSHGDEKVLRIPAQLGSYVDSLEYVVTVSFGTPAVPRVVIMDTGSDLSWLQCKPCASGECSPQKDPLFDPTNSSTYASIPCASDACKKLEADAYSIGCAKGGKQCGFKIMYADFTMTDGVYSKDKLTLAPGVTVNNFYFGCGHDERTAGGLYDGLLGLGLMSESLLAQFGGGATSYCLPAVSSKAGFLALGAGKNTDGFQLTPMGRVPKEPTFATVTLTGISVGGKKLSLLPSAFEGGMIVDSGSALTALQTTAFKALRSAFRDAMAAYPLAPNPNHYVDTCYNFTGHKNVVVPKIALTFSGGATINLDVPNGILVNDCLAFVDSGLLPGHSTAGILGNVNQRTFEVLFDTSSNKVGFRANAC
ncbi:unnamed protein product [Urochloa decumbens]|uniref:Peptidase A1 domain-containing protein n=1 Tax=Urochloa decumbens TaxID=240449 RepID=A0ABC9DYI2_9POAL